MSAQSGACAIPSNPSPDQPNRSRKQNVLRGVLNTFRTSSLKAWFSLKTPKHPNCSRSEILIQGNHRCVYCDTPLVEGENATVDHLLPRCLFRIEKIANQPGNRLACCRTCNRLKGEWHLPPRHLSWQSREAYLATTRRVVLGRRGEASSPPPSLIHESRPDVFRLAAGPCTSAKNLGKKSRKA